MNSNHIQRLCLATMLLVAAAVAQTQAPQPAALPIGNASIAAVKGAVTFKTAAGADIPADQGQALAPGTVIETSKGSAVLNLPDGSQVQVKPNSRVVIQDPLADKHFSLEMFLGKLLAKVQKRVGATPSFRMGTPTAVITVRGTEFQVDVSKKGRTEVHVYDGIVEVTSNVPGSSPVLIRPGFYTNVDPDRGPDSPRQFAPQDRMQDPDSSNRSRAGDSRYGDDSSSRTRTGDSTDRQSSSTQSSSEHDH